MSAAAGGGSAVTSVPIAGVVEFSGSVAIQLPAGVTARVHDGAVWLYGTRDGVMEFLTRAEGLRREIQLQMLSAKVRAFVDACNGIFP